MDHSKMRSAPLAEAHTRNRSGHPLGNCRKVLNGNLWPFGLPALGVTPLLVIAGRGAP